MQIAAVCVYVYSFIFVGDGALTVEPGSPFVNNALLGIGVFDRWVIVGDKI